EADVAAAAVGNLRVGVRAVHHGIRVIDRAARGGGVIAGGVHAGGRAAAGVAELEVAQRDHEVDVGRDVQVVQRVDGVDERPRILVAALDADGGQQVQEGDVAAQVAQHRHGRLEGVDHRLHDLRDLLDVLDEWADE